MTATFTANKLYIRKVKTVMLEGNRSKINVMWHINMQNEHLEDNAHLKKIANSIYEIIKRGNNKLILPRNVEPYS